MKKLKKLDHHKRLLILSIWVKHHKLLNNNLLKLTKDKIKQMMKNHQLHALISLECQIISMLTLLNIKLNGLK